MSRRSSFAISRSLPRRGSSLPRSLRDSRLLAASASLAASFAVAALVPLSASAQTVAINTNPGIVRLSKEGKEEPARDQTLKVNFINLDDCLQDRSYRVPLTLVLPPARDASLQIWAGTSGQDCSILANRSGPQGTCWRAGFDIPFDNVNAQPTVRIQDILRQDRTYQAFVAPADSKVCIATGKQTINLFFVWVRNGATGEGISNVTQTFEVRTQGPAAPTGVTAGGGDAKAFVSWRAPADVVDVASYSLYCDDVPAGSAASPLEADADVDAETADAGAETADAGDAGADAGDAGADSAVPVASCGNGAIVPGQVPIGLRKCGSIAGATATETTADKLTNGVTTRIAVAAVDNFGNPGVVSAVACATPGPVDDFFDGYKAAGGGAGCAIVAGEGAPWGAGLLVGLLATLTTLRRRARKSGGAR